MIEEGVLEVTAPDDDDIRRCRQLMERYQNVPMDLADATLVALAEKTRLLRVFTLDADFYVYRTEEGGAFEVVPPPEP